MKKTLFLSAILGAALCSSAWSATLSTDTSVEGGVTYNGGIYTMGGSGNFSGRTFTADVTSTNGTITADSTTTWNSFAYIGDRQAGHTLHLTGADTNQSVWTDFGPFSLGGLIVDAGSGTWTAGRNDTGKDTALQFVGSSDVNLTINASTTLQGSSGVNVMTGGTWAIADGKVLTLSSSSGNMTISAGETVTLRGAGSLSLDTNKVIFNKGASFALSDNSVLTFKNNSTVNVLSDGTESGIPTTGNGFSNISYTCNVATGNGTVNATGVTWQINGSTEGVTYADGVVSKAPVQSTIYYINDATAEWDLRGATDVKINAASDATVDFGSTARGALNVTVNSGTLQTSRNDGTAFVTGDVVVNGGATLALRGQDALGWGTTATKSITLNGTDAEHLAVMDLTFTGGSTTMKTALNLHGFSAITGTREFNTFGGNIDVTGTNNEISAGVSVRNDATVTVGNGATLLISGTISKNSGGSGKLTKTGNGTLTITGDVTGGSIKGDGSKTILLNNTLSGGTFENVTFSGSEVNGTITLNGATGEGKLQSIMGTLSKAEGGTATIQLNADGKDFAITDTDFSTNGYNMTFLDAARINGHGWSTADPSGRAFSVLTGDTVLAKAGLKVESKGTIKVEGGTLNITGVLTLGHDTAGTADENRAHAVLNSGSLTVGNITKNSGYGDTSNTFTMTGGTLTFTEPATKTIMVNGTETDPDTNQPIQVPQEVNTNALAGVLATISGGTLSTAEAAWKIDNANASIGGVTISGANAAELANVTLTSTITAQTSVTFSGAITYTGDTFDRNVARTEGNGFGTIDKVATVATGNGSITNSATSWTLNGETATYANKELVYHTSEASDIYYANVAAEELDITGANELLVKQNVSLAAGDYTLSHYAEVTNGATLTVGAETTLTAEEYLEVRANATLAIDGTAAATGTAKNYGLWMHNGAKVQIADDATLTVQGMTFTSGKGETTITATGDTQIGGTNMSAPSNATITNADITVNSGHFRAYNVSGGSLTVATGTTTNVASALSDTTDVIVNNEGTSVVFNAADITVQSLTMAGGTTVTVGTADNHDYSFITSTLTVTGSDATLNADLVVKNNGKLDFSAGQALTMGCGVEIGDNVTVVIDAAMLEDIKQGTAMTIITNVDAGAITLGSNINFVDAQGQALGGGLRLDTVATADNKLAIVVAPEPATTTLSLLALAGLMARRKRH